MSKPTGIKFVDQVLAIVTGDKAQANAIKNEKLSKAAIKGQISALEGEIVHNEMAVEKAKENYRHAILLIDSESGNSKEFPSTPTAYIRSIVDAKKALDAAEAELKSTQESLVRLNEILTELF